MTTLSPPAAPRCPSRRAPSRATALARVRGWLATGVLAVAAAVLPGGAAAQALSLRQTWEGPMGYVTAATSVRTDPNNVDPCAVVAQNRSTSLTLSGIPAGATIRNAFLYWAGSFSSGGTAADYSVTLNGNNINATSTHTSTFNNGGTPFDYFGARADVTSRVTGNGSYTLSGLRVHTGSPHCGSAGVVGGWALYVIYEHPALPIRRVQLLDGLRAFRQATEPVALAGASRLEIAPSHVSSFTYLVYDGDPDLSAAENIVYNNVILSNADNPVNNPFNSSTDYGVDLDTWDATDYTQPGASSANLNLSVGDDMVILQAIITSLDTKGVVVTPDGSAPTPRLQGGAYSDLFVAENTSIIAGTFDLLAVGASGVVTIDSIRGVGLTGPQARADSGRVNLSAGTPVNYRVWYRVPQGAPVTVPVSLRARWVAYPTQVGGVDTGFVSVRRVQPQISLTKSVSPVGVLAGGTDLTYTMTAANVGEYAATGVVVSDVVPIEVAFKIGSATQQLPPGLTATVTYHAANGTAITPGTPACTSPAGYDTCVREVRWTVAGELPSGSGAPPGTFSFVARIR
ncbi:MAG TPA: DUF3344 domain-containing protein [Longimicrobium sp.]